MGMNEEILIAAMLNSTPITEFTPQNNKQAYLARLCGVDIPLPEPDTMEEALLYNLCVNGGGGSMKINDASYLFYNGARLDQKEELLKAASGASDMSYMFSGCSELKSVDMSSFDTSKASRMTGMFSGCDNIEEIIGFSAANKAGISIGFPAGSALRRMTFRTDIVNPIRSAINIADCKFERAEMIELFNSLPDISSLGLSASRKVLTIAGNPCAVGGNVQFEAGTYEFATYAELERKITRDGLEDVVCTINFEGSTMSVTGAELLGYFTEGDTNIVVGIPGYIKTYEMLTAEDKAIATNKGWTVV